VVSNAFVEFVIDTWYTNTTEYPALASAIVNLQTPGAGGLQTATVQMELDLGANETTDVMRRAYFTSDSGSGFSDSRELGNYIPAGARYRWWIASGSAIIDNTAPFGGYLVYFGSGGGGGSVDSSTLVLRNNGVSTNQTLVDATFEGTNTFQSIIADSLVGDGAGLTNMNAATWDGLTNYTAVYAERDTNRLVVTGFNLGGGTYYWLADRWTNSVFGIYRDVGDGLYYMTNSGGFLYASEANTVQPTVWEDFGGGEPVGTAYFPTNQTEAIALRASHAYPPDFPAGIRGTSGMFGTGLTNFFGAQQNLSGSVFWSEDFPNGAIASADIIFYGTKQSAASAHRGVIYGDSIFVAASGVFDIACTNADFFVLGSEFLKVRNGNGVSGLINVLAFDDDSHGASYTFLNATLVTNRNANFSTFMGTGSANAGSSLLLNTEGSWLGHYGNSTNSGANNSVLLGQGFQTTNAVRSTLMGRSHRANNATNSYALGEGLTAQNNTVQVGFTGANIKIATNSIQATVGGATRDVVLNGHTLPTFNQGISLTNNASGSSAAINATALDDIEDVVSDSIIFNPSGVASGGAYMGWVFGQVYPSFFPVGIHSLAIHPTGITNAPGLGTDSAGKIVARGGSTMLMAGFVQQTVTASRHYAFPPGYYGGNYNSNLGNTNVAANIWRAPYNLTLTNLYASWNNSSGADMSGSNFVATVMTNGVIDPSSSVVLTAGAHGEVTFSTAQNLSWSANLDAGDRLGFLLLNTNSSSPTSQHFNVSLEAYQR
jgi:hypothetical protein